MEQIGHDLTTEAAASPSSSRSNLLRACAELLHHVQTISQAVGDAFQDGARQMRRGMPRAEAEERSPRHPVELRGAFARQISKAHQSLRPETGPPVKLPSFF